MNLGELIDLAGFIAKDKNPDFQLSPNEFNLLLKVNNIRHFKEKIGLPEQYQPGRPLPKQVPEITRKVATDLQPFKVYMGSGTGANATPLPVEDGFAAIPDDYYYHLSMNYKWIKNGVAHKRPVDEVDDLEWQQRHDNPLTKGTKRNPICNYQATEIRFQPEEIMYVEFTYYRLPNEPNLVMKYSSGYAEYDASNSTELEWDDVNQIDILHKVMSDLGFSMEKAEVVQYAEQHKAQGV